MSEKVIEIENLKKEYRLGAIGGGTLTADLQSWWARKKKKEDPNLKFGVGYSNTGDIFYALKGINLEIKKGEALGIIGHNGAGKSTLLKILSRVTAPTEGTVRINGRIASMLEVGTGFHPELTGRENIYMNAAILGMHKAEIKDKIENIIDFSECRQFIDTPVKRYSSGMYVRLAFAVAAHLDAEILLMDEVLAVGDMRFQQKSLGKMGDVAEKEGKTVLYVSHNMATIQNLCTRCIVLDSGKIIFDGAVDDAIRYYMDYSIDGSAKLDLRYAPRWDNNTGFVTMEEFEFIDQDSISFISDQFVKCRLRYRYNKNLGRLSLKFVIRYIDTTVAGIYLKTDIIPGETGEERDILFDLDLSALAPGNYEFRMVLFELMDNGQEIGHDTLQYCGRLNIIRKPETVHNLKWVHSTYGHIYLGDL